MGQTAEDRRVSGCLPAAVAVGSPSILRAPDAARKELTVKFEDSKPLDVRQVLDQLHAGNTDPYDELCRELAKGLMSSSLLGETLDELHRCAGDLCGERHLSLIRASLACSWHHLSQHYTQRYFALVVLLATTQPSCASDAVKVLVHTLQYNEEFDQLGGGDPPFAGDLTEKELRVHGLALDALVSILRIIPMALDLVMSTVVGRMPYHKRPARQQAAYISSMLRLSSLLPNCRPRILRAVYQRLTQLDLLCPRSDLTASSSEDALDDLHQQLPHNNNPLKETAADGELVAALDTLMSVTLGHFVQICYGPSASLKSSTGDLVTFDDQHLDWVATKKLYLHLLTVVDELGLSTPSTAHAQFLAFWLACRRAALAEHWTDWLWRRVAENPSAPALYRQTAAVYLGSFLARATLASIGLVRATLEVMCGWVHRYLDRQEGVCGRGLADFVVHRPFYAVCQTIFYVIAFRHTEMPPTNAHLPFLRSLKLDRLVTSRLNPLQFCLPVVVRNFASVARHYQLAYCYTVIERNSRARIPVVFETSFGLKRPLTEGCQLTYFPFDPYLLQHSRRYITGVYREYAGQVVMSDSESSDSSDDDDDDDDDVMEQDSVHQFSRPVSIRLKSNLDVTASGDSVLAPSRNLLLESSEMI